MRRNIPVGPVMAAILAGSFLFSGCTPPSPAYPFSRAITKKRDTLYTELLALLPEGQRDLPAAQQEARWLADTAYKAAAGISRVNDSSFPGWAGNFFINIHMQNRGLCWHYQHDMYRELRRRPLHFFRIGCCVRDHACLTEHNCVYLTPVDNEWPKVMVLDAWLWNGRLTVSRGWELDQTDWEDLPAICCNLQEYYPEGHTAPIEHWAVIRSPQGMDVEVAATPEVRRYPIYRAMLRNINRGEKEHPNSPTNY